MIKLKSNQLFIRLLVVNQLFIRLLIFYLFLRGYCTPNQKSACFMLYLKIINTFLKKRYASYSKLSKELNNGIKL